MSNYTVTWSIEVDADTPKEAAEKARKIQLDPESTALYFEIYPMENNEVVESIDLLS